MAVYKRTYTGHDGPATASWSRFLIPGRYNYQRLMKQRFLMLFLTASLFYPIGCSIYVYLSANPDFLRLLGFAAIDIDGGFFYNFCRVQGVLAYLLTAFISPSLISWDLANGALPLYFCRPFTRVEYVLAKLSVLLPLLSMITWIPAVLLFVIKASISPWSWFSDYWWLGRGVFLGLFAWCLLLCLIGLAMSAWVKWRIAAGGLILAIFFFGGGFAEAINEVMNIQAASLLDLTAVIHTIWADLLRYDAESELTVTSAWIVVGVVTTICLWLLHKRIRTFEVVK